MGNASIRQLHPNDWEPFRKLRLESLLKHPDCFCPSRDEFKFTEADWRERLSNANAGSFGLFVDGVMVGLTGIIREGNNPQATKAVLVSSYIQEPYRKRGLSKLLFEARLAWAKEQKNIEIVAVEHRDDNLPSKKANQNFGFRLIGSREVEWPDGQVRPALTYELSL